MRVLSVISFLAVASLFSAPARAVDNALPTMETPQPQAPEQKSIMMREWAVTPPVQGGGGHIGLQQPETTPSAAAAQTDERVSPEQPAYGTNPHLQKNEEAAPSVPETPAPVAPPQGDFTELRQMDSATVDQVIDPLRIRLKDKRIVHLSGIDVPDLDVYEPGDISAGAMQYLSALMNGQPIRLYQTRDPNKGRTNRLGHTLAHMVMREGDVWVQGAMLANGWARIRPTERNPEMAAQMIALEQQARQNKLGLWASERYALLTPETAEKALNDWAIVEGTVRKVGMVNNVLYLNFGDDWRSDFTVALTTPIRRQMEKAGINPQTLGGVTVRARGWMREYNGPYMELNNAAWLEIEKPAAE